LKLLFDQNLASKLPARLADLFSGSTQALLAALDVASDRDVRAYAEKFGFIIVTRDRDFVELTSFSERRQKQFGLPDNSTGDYEQLLRSLHEQIEAFASDPLRTLLVID
jgi:predicted nuclease of predicted toxin-antitoxin system